MPRWDDTLMTPTAADAVAGEQAADGTAASEQPAAAGEAEREQTEVEFIEQTAEVWGVEPILARQDLPSVELIDDDVLCNWMRLVEDPLIAILEDGSILTNKPYALVANTARTMLMRMGRVGVIRPAVREVVNSVLKAKFGSEDDAAANTGVDVEDYETTTTGVQLLFNSILEAALARRVSDIHFEMRENTTNIKFRINGALVVHDTISAAETMSLGNYMFNSEAKRGSMQFMTHQPLHGSMDVYLGGSVVALRLSTAPDIRGVDIFLRVWRPESGAIGLADLGYTSLQIDLLKQGIGRPYGALVMSGPTGSGKSTSLTALLETVDPRHKILSLEEPVERMLPNVTHVAISSQAEHGSWENLRAGLNRWDTNINMLGEIKDRDTALAIKDLATSGKMTLTTLHASNVLSIPVRMEDLGVERSMLYDPNFLVLLVNQRLVPELCERCKLDIEAVREHLDPGDHNRYRRLFGETASLLRFRNAEGCGHCHHSGVQSRVLVAEMVMMDDPSRHFIRERDQLGWREHLLKKGWRPISDHARIHVEAGRVDAQDVERVVGRLDEHLTEVFDYGERERLLQEATH